MTDAFDKQLKAQQTRWEQLGSAAITWFVSGAEAGVTPATGQKIASAIFPFFAALLKESEPLP